MNLVELDRALRKLRLSGMADVLETRLRQAQAEHMAPIDLVSALVSDELLRREDRLFSRRHKLACFRDPDRSLDSFDFDFNKKMNRALVFELATARFIGQREDALFLGPPGTGKSHLAQAIGRAAIQQGYRVLYREAHALLEEIADNRRRHSQGLLRRARGRAAEEAPAQHPGAPSPAPGEAGRLVARARHPLAHPPGRDLLRSAASRQRSPPPR
jgi:DNA replication protein DnaC